MGIAILTERATLNGIVELLSTHDGRASWSVPSSSVVVAEWYKQLKYLSCVRSRSVRESLGMAVHDSKDESVEHRFATHHSERKYETLAH